MDPMLIGEKAIAISARGRTEHAETSYRKVIAQHLHMTRKRGEEWNDLVVDGLEIFFYNRATKAAYRFRRITLIHGQISGLMDAEEIAYETIQEQAK